MRALAVGLGRRVHAGIGEFGYASLLFAEGLYWLVAGVFRNQPVRMAAVASEMVTIGVRAIPIVCVLAFANGVMMALQGIYTLKDFGAESQVIPGLAYSITREFGALIVGIVVAGRSGSSIAARIGAMQMSQEIDALQVMGINPVRYLVSPLLVAMMLMVPVLTILADVTALSGGGLLCVMQLHMSFDAFWNAALSVLEPGDFMQGLVKSLVFAILITLVGASNGFMAKGGADGLGRITTRSVVLCIAAIIVADMIFTFFLSR